MLLHLCGVSEINAEMAALVHDKTGKSIIHLIAIRLAHAFIGAESEIIEWQALLKQAVRAGTDIHALSGQGCTPFQEFLQELCGFLLYGRRSCMADCACFWAECVSITGLDMMAYGNREHAIWTCKQVMGISSWGFVYTANTGGVVSPIDFIFGEMPSDWQLVGKKERTYGVYRSMEYALPGSWRT
jgi:hypothetical protein